RLGEGSADPLPNRYAGRVGLLPERRHIALCAARPGGLSSLSARFRKGKCRRPDERLSEPDRRGVGQLSLLLMPPHRRGRRAPSHRNMTPPWHSLLPRIPARTSRRPRLGLEWQWHLVNFTGWLLQRWPYRYWPGPMPRERKISPTTGGWAWSNCLPAR